MPKKTSIRSVLVNLVDDGLIQIEGNFRKALKTKESSKTPERKHRAITLKEIELLMSILSNKSLQEQLEILIPVLSGARPDEDVSLKVCNIDFATRRILFTETKGRKARNVPVSIHLLELLAKLIEEKGLSESDYLFSTRQSPKMSTKTLQNHLKELRKAAGIKRDITPHDLRASFAYLQYYHSNKKFDLIALQKLMGHAKIDQTSNYVGDQFEDGDKRGLDTLIKLWCSILSKKTVRMTKVQRIAS